MEKFNIKPFEIKKVQKLIESKETEELLNCLTSLEMHARTIGEGGNAEILAIEEGSFSKVCLKRIKEKPQLICNTIDRENELQGRARKLGVRTPLALVSIDTEYGEFFIMEKINGCNVQEALADPSLIPSNFSQKDFISDLKRQIEELHNAGIYHRDLHLRNIMINEEGLPVIIDFGTATEGSGSDLTYEGMGTSFNSKTGKYEQVAGIFKDDLKMLENLRLAILRLRRKENIDIRQ